ncbi:hypothetical protein [Amaricoccus sp.]|uniref:hypothetical protein n=1 Tax=Amaricoccus sp. TaxID=1872485 RepID=UPI001B4C8ADC|nr:hypothetical protein [Amaricoccus sp.]MBP7002618.1 hypothetical protein [Amaricoccus sp.]
MDERYEMTRAFENDVRNVCRELWPDAFSGSAETLQGHERDGVFRTLDTVHLVEATVSGKLQAAKEKLQKLTKLVSEMRREPANEDKNFQIWLVLKQDPTGNQAALKGDQAIRSKAKCPIHILSLQTLF